MASRGGRNWLVIALFIVMGFAAFGIVFFLVCSVAFRG
jgi:hypothetical protein